jgi:hypothetical protein
MKKVIIHVRGGVAEVIYSPPEIEVEIIDFDNDQVVSKFFEVTGYFFDTYMKEETYIMKEFDDELNYMYSDDEILFEDVTEQEIIEAIMTQKPIGDFFITSYKIIS